MAKTATTTIKKLLKIIYVVMIILGLLLLGMIFFMFLNDILIRFHYFTYPPTITEENRPDYLYCNSDNDCATTYYPLDGCCMRCNIFPINSEGLKLQEKWRNDNCDYAQIPCPEYKCLWPRKNVSCVQNKCVLNEKENTDLAENERFSLNCLNECSSQDKSLILSTAQKTLEVFQKEFPWMAEAALKTHYNIEVNLSDISADGRSYVDYEKRTVKLTRIYTPTIAHEVSHLLVAESFGLEERTSDMLSDAPLFPKGPTWLHEGLAMYLEYRVDDSRRAKDISLLRSASQFLDEEKFMQGQIGESLKLFYTQSWSLTEFLIEKGGKERLYLMIKEAQKNPRRKMVCQEWDNFLKSCIYGELVIAAFWEESFNEIYKDITPNWESFYEEWTEYVKRI